MIVRQNCFSRVALLDKENIRNFSEKRRRSDRTGFSHGVKKFPYWRPAGRCGSLKAGVGCWRFDVSNGYEVVNGYQLHS